MFAPDDVLVLHPKTQLKAWQEQGVLFHAPSNATLLLSSIMIDALKQLAKRPSSLQEIANNLCQNYPDLTDDERSAIFDTLEQGLSSLLIDGIIQVTELSETALP